MRVCILAFDGLEFSIIDRYRSLLRSLAQKMYGKYPSDINLNSVQLWSMFLTGASRAPDRGVFVYRRRYGDLLPRIVKRCLGKIGFKALLLRKPALYLKPPKVSGRTIFDLAEKPLPVNVFCYNEDRELFEFRVRNSIPRLLKLPLEERIKAVKQRIELERKMLNRFTKMLSERSWDLAMFYARFVDDAGHLVCRSMKDALRYHLIADKWAKEVGELLERGDLLLIVSDHGLIRGVHTPYAFYSLNTLLELEVHSISDFYNLIGEWLKNELTRGCNREFS